MSKTKDINNYNEKDIIEGYWQCNRNDGPRPFCQDMGGPSSPPSGISGFNSQEQCESRSRPCKRRWKCNPIIGTCSKSAFGAEPGFNDEESCNSTCSQEDTNFICANGICTEVEGTGPHQTVEECQTATGCSAPPYTYNCTEGICTEVRGNGGTHPSLIDCERSGCVVGSSFECSQGSCQERIDRSGGYYSINQCLLAGCGDVTKSYNCESGECIEVEGLGGEFPTLVDCHTHCNFDHSYVCNPATNRCEELANDSGEFANLELCENTGCGEPDSESFTCQNGVCREIQSNAGEFATHNECIRSGCSSASQSGYICHNNTCQSVHGPGDYRTLEQCQAAGCELSYNCIDGERCEAIRGSGGEYLTMEDCENQCGGSIHCRNNSCTFLPGLANNGRYGNVDECQGGEEGCEQVHFTCTSSGRTGPHPGPGTGPNQFSAGGNTGVSELDAQNACDAQCINYVCDPTDDVSAQGSCTSVTGITGTDRDGPSGQAACQEAGCETQKWVCGQDGCSQVFREGNADPANPLEHEDQASCEAACIHFTCVPPTDPDLCFQSDGTTPCAEWDGVNATSCHNACPGAIFQPTSSGAQQGVGVVDEASGRYATAADVEAAGCSTNYYSCDSGNGCSVVKGGTANYPEDANNLPSGTFSDLTTCETDACSGHSYNCNSTPGSEACEILDGIGSGTYRNYDSCDTACLTHHICDPVTQVCTEAAGEADPANPAEFATVAECRANGCETVHYNCGVNGCEQVLRGDGAGGINPAFDTAEFKGPNNEGGDAALTQCETSCRRWVCENNSCGDTWEAGNADGANQYTSENDCLDNCGRSVSCSGNTCTAQDGQRGIWRDTLNDGSVTEADLISQCQSGASSDGVICESRKFVCGPTSADNATGCTEVLGEGTADPANPLEFDTQAACEAGCKSVNCVAPDFGGGDDDNVSPSVCTEVNGSEGTYTPVSANAAGFANAMEACETGSSCETVTYNCTGTGCVIQRNNTGTYQDLAACQSDCIHYECENDACVEYEGSAGTFNTLFGPDGCTVSCEEYFEFDGTRCVRRSGRKDPANSDQYYTIEECSANNPLAQPTVTIACSNGNCYGRNIDITWNDNGLSDSAGQTRLILNKINADGSLVEKYRDQTSIGSSSTTITVTQIGTYQATLSVDSYPGSPVLEVTSNSIELLELPGISLTGSNLGWRDITSFELNFSADSADNDFTVVVQQVDASSTVGNPVLLDPNPPAIFTFDQTDALSQTFTIDTNGYYYVTLTTNGITVTIDSIINVQDPPLITLVPSSGWIVTPFTLEWTIRDNFGLQVDISIPNSSFAESNVGNSGIRTSVMINTAGSYQAAVTTDVGTVLSSSVLVQDVPVPSINFVYTGGNIVAQNAWSNWTDLNLAWNLGNWDRDYTVTLRNSSGIVPNIIVTRGNPAITWQDLTQNDDPSPFGLFFFVEDGTYTATLTLSDDSWTGTPVETTIEVHSIPVPVFTTTLPSKYNFVGDNVVLNWPSVDFADYILEVYPVADINSYNRTGPNVFEYTQDDGINTDTRTYERGYYIAKITVFPGQARSQSQNSNQIGVLTRPTISLDPERGWNDVPDYFTLTWTNDDPDITAYNLQVSQVTPDTTDPAIPTFVDPANIPFSGDEQLVSPQQVTLSSGRYLATLEITSPTSAVIGSDKINIVSDVPTIIFEWSNPSISWGGSSTLTWDDGGIGNAIVEILRPDGTSHYNNTDAASGSTAMSQVIIPGTWTATMSVPDESWLNIPDAILTVAAPPGPDTFILRTPITLPGSVGIFYNVTDNTMYVSEELSLYLNYPELNIPNVESNLSFVITDAGGNVVRNLLDTTINNTNLPYTFTADAISVGTATATLTTPYDTYTISTTILSDPQPSIEFQPASANLNETNIDLVWQDDGLDPSNIIIKITKPDGTQFQVDISTVSSPYRFTTDLPVDEVGTYTAEMFSRVETISAELIISYDIPQINVVDDNGNSISDGQAHANDQTYTISWYPQFAPINNLEVYSLQGGQRVSLDQTIIPQSLWANGTITFTPVDMGLISGTFIAVITTDGGEDSKEFIINYPLPTISVTPLDGGVANVTEYTITWDTHGAQWTGNDFQLFHFSEPGIDLQTAPAARIFLRNAFLSQIHAAGTPIPLSGSWSGTLPVHGTYDVIAQTTAGPQQIVKFVVEAPVVCAGPNCRQVGAAGAAGDWENDLLMYAIGGTEITDFYATLEECNAGNSCNRTRWTCDIKGTELAGGGLGDFASNAVCTEKQNIPEWSPTEVRMYNGEPVTEFQFSSEDNCRRHSSSKFPRAKCTDDGCQVIQPTGDSCLSNGVNPPVCDQIPTEEWQPNGSYPTEIDADGNIVREATAVCTDDCKFKCNYAPYDHNPDNIPCIRSLNPSEDLSKGITLYNTKTACAGQPTTSATLSDGVNARYTKLYCSEHIDEMACAIGEQVGTGRQDPTVQGDPCYQSATPGQLPEGHGICTQGYNWNDYTCNCFAGYSGDNCENDDLCIPDPCQNGGVCSHNDPSQPTHTCECPNGYLGDNCEIVGICVSNNPCQNGSQCVQGATQNDYTCECLTDYGGPNCQYRTRCGEDQYISETQVGSGMGTCINCTACGGVNTNSIRVRSTACNGTTTRDNVCVNNRLWCGTDYCDLADNGSSDRDQHEEDLLSCANVRNSAGTSYTTIQSGGRGDVPDGVTVSYEDDGFVEYPQVFPFANVFRRKCKCANCG